MIIKLERLEVISRDEFEMIDITSRVDDFIATSGIKDGVVFVTSAHTTSSLVVTEGVECLEKDVPLHLERMSPKYPPEDGSWGWYHNRLLDFDGRMGFNAGDHIKSILGGIQCFFPIENGRMVRGGRQTIYFVEYDGPLARTIFVQVMGQ
ncbi:MAG: secondary thiamine-phosphate synthase enzyme YjbQ [Bryobacteraceae bacterium]